MLNMNQTGEFLQKLKDHLRVLFQFDCADLDFGIYQIMNYKRAEIEKFIEDDLIGVVEKEFEKYKVQNQKELLEKIEEKRKEVRKLEKGLGEKILKNGEIEEKFKDKPFAKEYIELKKRIEEIDITENIQSQVFNDLYNFFSRYYEDGDFISKRRYSSKQNKYAIPYNGEEVKLYWANFDQYYIKTGEIFKDYEFNLKGWKFVFRTVLADVEAGNVKGNRRYFFLSSDDPIKISNKTCLIKFEYRMLTNGDLKQYPVKTKEGKAKTIRITQDELNPILKDKILTSITPLEPKTILTETQDEKTILEKHLYKYTRKITSDFFIHKNLKDFLERELDYFIKTEVLDIESFDTERERYFDRHITRAKVVKNIGKRIIEFLSQIEDFQKMLWEKKKFVLKTDYVITVDRIPEDFYKEILENKKQLKEWQELGFGKIKTKKDLNNKKLPVDTKYFSEDFKERLLEKLSEKGNLDDLIDGILIKSEHWQALNLILEKHKESVRCIYIDPPYNTGNDEFLYKDRYQHSSWLSMLHDRLNLAKNIMNPEGVIFTSIGDLIPQQGESYRLQFLLNMIFEKRFGNLVWKKRGGIGSFSEKDLTENHEYVTVNGNVKSFIYDNILSEKKIAEFKEKDDKGTFRWMGLIGPSQQTKDRRPNLNYGILYDTTKDRIVGFEYFENNHKKREYFEQEKSKNIHAIWLEGKATWLISRTVLEKYYREGLIKVFKKSGKYIVKIKNYLLKPDGTINGDILKSILVDNGIKIGMNAEATKELNNLFPTLDTTGLNPKPVSLIKLLLYVTCIKNETIMDFFGGSGTTAHAVMKLNKENGGRRKYILVEMADYFDTVIIPRLKKVCYSVNWKDGKPQDTDGISQIIKYHYLEQYEDTLHNIEFPQEQRAQKMLALFTEEAKTEYLMKYILKFETEGSPSLLNLSAFESPFEYKLKIISSGKGEEIVNVDLVETFNYLIGLKIGRYKFLKENGRKYVFVFGERNNRKTAIVWRSTKDINLAKDKEIIDKELASFNPDEVFINGDSFVKGYKPIESEFKALMER